MCDGTAMAGETKDCLLSKENKKLMSLILFVWGFFLLFYTLKKISLILVFWTAKCFLKSFVAHIFVRANGFGRLESSSEVKQMSHPDTEEW